MAWIKVKSSVTHKTMLMPENAYETFHKNKGIFTVVEEPKQTKQEPKSKQPKEETKNVESVQFDVKNEVNPSGKDNKKA